MRLGQALLYATHTYFNLDCTMDLPVNPEDPGRSVPAQAVNHITSRFLSWTRGQSDPFCIPKKAGKKLNTYGAGTPVGVPFNSFNHEARRECRWSPSRRNHCAHRRDTGCCPPPVYAEVHLEYDVVRRLYGDRILGRSFHHHASCTQYMLTTILFPMQFCLVGLVIQNFHNISTGLGSHLSEIPVEGLVDFFKVSTHFRASGYYRRHGLTFARISGSASWSTRSPSSSPN